MSRNNENVAEVHTFVTTDWCVMTEQINEIGISCGLVQSVLKEDLSMLCGVFVCERESSRLCLCMAVHACILMEDHMEIRKVNTVELFEGLVQVADSVLLIINGNIVYFFACDSQMKLQLSELHTNMSPPP